jgi:hypothetical protein
MKSRPSPSSPLDDLAVLTPQGAEYLASLHLGGERDALQVPGAEHAVTATSYAPCSSGCGALIPPSDRLASPMCQECQAERTLHRYVALFGDDDAPFCSRCNRHHSRGAHYATIAI